MLPEAEWKLSVRAPPHERTVPERRDRSRSRRPIRHRLGGIQRLIESAVGETVLTMIIEDLSGFVEEARRNVAREVSLSPGYYVEWSGRWESHVQAAKLKARKEIEPTRYGATTWGVESNGA